MELGRLGLDTVGLRTAIAGSLYSVFHGHSRSVIFELAARSSAL